MPGKASRARHNAKRNMRKRRKSSTRDFVAMGYRVHAPGKLKTEVFGAMLRALDGDSLPSGIEVTWRWQNNPRGPWREGDLETVVRESSRGDFIGLMRQRIERDRDRFS